MLTASVGDLPVWWTTTFGSPIVKDSWWWKRTAATTTRGYEDTNGTCFRYNKCVSLLRPTGSRKMITSKGKLRGGATAKIVILVCSNNRCCPEQMRPYDWKKERHSGGCVWHPAPTTQRRKPLSIRYHPWFLIDSHTDQQLLDGGPVYRQIRLIRGKNFFMWPPPTSRSWHNSQ